MPDTSISNLPVGSPPRRSALAHLYFRVEHQLLGGVALAAFLCFWQGLSNGLWADLLQPLLGDMASQLRIRPIFISSPTRVAMKVQEMFSTGEIWDHLVASGVTFGLGGLIGVLFGIPLGLAVGWYRRLRYAVEPFLSAYNATPQVVFIPLLIIWVGTGLATKVLIIAMVTFIPLTMSTMAAVKTTDPRLLKVAKSFGASDWQLFRDIILPTSLPYVLSGLRLGVGRAMVGVVVGEIYASSAGIGYLINVSGASFQTDRVFVGILVIAVVGLLLTWCIHALERRVDNWRPRQAATA